MEKAIFQNIIDIFLTCIMSLPINRKEPLQK